MLQRLEAAVWRNLARQFVEDGETFLIESNLKDVFVETTQESTCISAMELGENDRLLFLLNSGNGSQPNLIELDLFARDLCLYRAKEDLGVSEAIIASALNDLRHLRRRLEAQFLGAVETGCCAISARRTPCGPYESVLWEEFKYYKIDDWRHGSALRLDGRALFDIQIRPADEQADRFAPIVTVFKTYARPTRQACIELMESATIPLGRGTGPKSTRLKVHLSANTFTKIRKFLDQEVFSLDTDLQKIVLKRFKDIIKP